MFMIASFNRAKHMHGSNVRAGERAIVHHLFDACAGGGDLRGKVGKTAGAIADHGAETAEAAICNQTTLDYTTEHIRVNGTAAEQKYYALAREMAKFSRQTRCERSRGCTFDDAFF